MSSGYGEAFFNAGARGLVLTAELEADERLLRDLAGCADVDSKISGSGAGEDAHGSVLKLAWGVLLSQYGPEHVAGASFVDTFVCNLGAMLWMVVCSLTIRVQPAASQLVQHATAASLVCSA